VAPQDADIMVIYAKNITATDDPQVVYKNV